MAEQELPPRTASPTHILSPPRQRKSGKIFVNQKYLIKISQAGKPVGNEQPASARSGRQTPDDDACSIISTDSSKLFLQNFPKFILSCEKNLANRTWSRLVLRLHEQLQRTRLRVQRFSNKTCWSSTVCDYSEGVYAAPSPAEGEIEGVRSGWE